MKDDDRLRRVRRLSHLLDSSIRIPGTSYTIGIDPLIGLVPVVGDLVGLLISAYIVVEAARLGVPVSTVLRMTFNIVVESVLGSVPLAGDVLDAVWKANERNVALLESRYESSEKAKSDRRFLAFVVVLVFVTAVVTVAVLVWLALYAIDLLV